LTVDVTIDVGFGIAPHDSVIRALTMQAVARFERIAGHDATWFAGVVDVTSLPIEIIRAVEISARCSLRDLLRTSVASHHYCDPERRIAPSAYRFRFRATTIAQKA
jgi:hypothetical protein